MTAYLELIGYPLPDDAAGGRVGETIRMIRDRLDRGLPPTDAQRARWSRLLEHNRHDCVGMRRVCLRATREIEMTSDNGVPGGKQEDFETRPATCPRCGADGPLRIAYGYPSHEMMEAAQRQELVLGGCIVGFGSPTWECWNCDHRWGGPPTRLDGLAAITFGPAPETQAGD